MTATTEPSTRPPTATRFLLTVLFLSTFTLGTAELLVVGVLTDIAANLDVTVSAAGAVVTSYALGLAIGGPVLSILTSRLDRRHILLAAVTLSVALTIGAAFASSLFWVIVMRSLAGALQGLFVGAAFSVALSTVPPERTGRAISAVIGGFAFAVALGLPMGTAVGEALGWRAAYLLPAAAGLFILLALAVVTPSVAGSDHPQRDQVRHAFGPSVLLVLMTALVVFAGQYSALTYISPFLQDRVGIASGAVSTFLLAYGVATAVGVFGGGRLADHSPGRVILIVNLLLVAVLAVLLLVSGSPVAVAAVLLLWGLLSLGMVPSVQARAIDLAGPGGQIAASLPASAINIGIAAGSVFGGIALDASGPRAPLMTGIVICALAIPLAALASRLRHRPDADDPAGQVVVSDAPGVA